MRAQEFQRRAFTLLEVTLVVGILVVISAMVVPNFILQIEADALPRSGRQLRSLIAMTRANAAFDGKRYRIRFPNENEEDLFGGRSQPLVEREDDPIDDPQVFNVVTSPWAIDKTFLGEVWCAEVRLGKPTIDQIRDKRERVAEGIEESLEEVFGDEDLDAERPPLMIEPDGSSEWATFVLTDAPPEIAFDELENYARIEVILDGPLGLAWLQRPFYDEELDLFEEKNWPAVLRQDFLDPRVLTEDDVLEIRESEVKGRRMEFRGRKMVEEP